MKKKLAYVDALRGIAVLSVVATHVGLNSLIGIAHKFSDLGAKGVELFYFVSAFTLFLSVHDRKTSDRNPYIDFAIRRIFRIAPLYFVAILYYAILIPLYRANPISWTGILTNLTFTHGLFPKYINTVVPGGWSIGVEMMFYCLVPLLAARIDSLKKAGIFLAISLGIGLSCKILLVNNPFHYNPELWKYYLYWYLPSQICVFACGIFFYFLTKNSTLRSIKWVTALLLLLLFLLIIADQLFLNIGTLIINFGLGIVFLILAFVMRKYRMRLLNNSFTQLLGRLSFSIYLNHFAVIFWLQHYSIIEIEHYAGFTNFLYAYTVVLLVTAIISGITYSLVELRGQEYGKWIISRIGAGRIDSVEN